MVALLNDAVTPTKKDAELARESSRQLSRYAKRNLRVHIALDNGLKEEVELPASAVRLLVQILTEMSAGHAVTLIPIHAELTTQEAAELLNVSRPFLVNKLLKEGKIRFRQVGAHRRILFRDLMDYKRVSDAERDRALDALVADSQEMGLY